MTAVAPRPAVASSTSAATAPAAAARPADRSDGTGGRDFEAVLRGHGGKDAVTPRPRPQDRDAHAPAPRHSSPDHADRTDGSSSTAVAALADGARPAPDPAGPAPDPARPRSDPAAGPSVGPAAEGTGAPVVPSGAPASPMTPVTPSPTTGVSVTADATATGGTPRAATVPTSATSTPDVPDATAAPVVAGATPTGAQGVAAAHGPDARTPSALTGGTVPGDASAGSAAPADRTDGPDGASRAVGVVAAATASADTATGQVRAADRSAPTVDPGPTPTATAGTVDGAPAYALTPTGAPHGGTGAPMVTTADARLAQPALPPQAQVLNAVSPLLTTADGTHRLTVHLAPAHLGSVQVHLEVRGGEVTVRLTAVDPATGDALRQGTPELRSHLERIGLRSAGIDVQVAPGAPTGDPAAGGAATADRGPRDQDQRNPGPWAGPDGTGAGDTARDGAWQRHGRPLEGWTPRADGPRTTRHTPGASDQLDPHRPRPRDVRVDVRM